MKKFHAVVYDAEIVNCVPDRNDTAVDPNYTYCKGWGDKAGMGVSVVCALDMWTGLSHVYLEDNLPEFQLLVASRASLVGFNSKGFDDGLLAAAGVPVKTTFDLKEAFGGLLPGGVRVKGRTLNDYCRVNLPGSGGKSMDGSEAPRAWQRKEYGRVIDYCMKDVFLTAKLLSLLPSIIDPVSGQSFTIPVPPALIEEGQQEMFLPNGAELVAAA